MTLTADSTITLLTAPPGSGKTLRLVWHVREALRANDGPVYVCNLNGLSREGEFSGWLEFNDPTCWMELPSGCTLVVDECQDYFRPDGSRTLPPYLTEMERIRHYGVRLVLATQHHTFIHSHVQKLVTKHEHLVRENGAASALVYRRSSIIANTSSDRALAKEDHEKWAYPKELFVAYKSAQVHTVKRSVKSKHKRAIVLFALAALIFGYVVYDVRSNISPSQAADGAAAGTAASQPQGGGGAFGHSRDRKEWETDPNKPGYRSDYARDHLPRFATMPWTAPVFDNRAVTADPQLICMSAMDGEDVAGDHREPSCTCLTEQSTRVEISQAECRKIARFGPAYNPYRQREPSEPRSRDFGGVGGLPPTAMAATAAAPSPGAAITAPQVSGYGDIGARRIEPATDSGF